MATKAELLAQVKAEEAAASASLKKNAPTLWWAQNYHRNNRNEKMKFDKLECLVALYMAIEKSKKMALEKCVQYGISEMFIIKSHLEARDGLSVMYVLPKYEQRNKFVSNRVWKLHSRVPAYKDLVKIGGSNNTHRMSMVDFGKGTIIYVGSNVDSEFIETPIDSAFVDEKDRCNQTNLLLLPDRYTASPHRFHREVSNPTVEGFGIDERYLLSSQGVWTIKCPHCRKSFTPDFFKHVVRQVDSRNWMPLDPDFDPDDASRDMRLYHDCGKPVDRLMPGEFHHQYPKREWQGYRISQLWSKFVELRAMYFEWIAAVGNPFKIQVFYNSRLGLPNTSKGAKITEEMLNKCRRDYTLLTPETAGNNPRIIGIDVGAGLNYIIRDVVKERGVVVRRLCTAGTVPTFELLKTEVLDKWRPRVAVIDAYPEIHKVMELKAKVKNLWSARFRQDQQKLMAQDESRELTIDRTAILDFVNQHTDSETNLLPSNAQFIDSGAYYAHMKASTRILEIDDEKPDVARYIWVHTQPDHYFLAEAYCEMAYMKLPNIDGVMEFFKENAKPVRPEINKIQGISDEQRAEYIRQSYLTPEDILRGLQRKFADTSKLRPRGSSEVPPVQPDKGKS